MCCFIVVYIADNCGFSYKAVLNVIRLGYMCVCVRLCVSASDDVIVSSADSWISQKTINRQWWVSASCCCCCYYCLSVSVVYLLINYVNVLYLAHVINCTLTIIRRVLANVTHLWLLFGYFTMQWTSEIQQQRSTLSSTASIDLLYVCYSSQATKSNNSSEKHHHSAALVRYSIVISYVHIHYKIR